jgi:hypothetical protein
MSEQVLIDEVHVCSIGIRGRDNVFIPAGRSFIKEALIEHSFDRLVSQGYISRFQREMPIQPIRKAVGNKLAAVENETPDAAINPPKQSQEQKVAAARQASQSVKDAKASKAQKDADKAQKVADDAAGIATEEKAAQEVLKASEDKAAEETKETNTEAPAKESTVETIWNCDPEAIKKHSFEQLLSAYRTECDKFKIEPEKFSDKKLLIAKLSSQFTAK